MGRVDFDGLVKEVCLSLVPEAQVGDSVIVHVGFAITKLKPEEAEEQKKLLEQLLNYETE